MSSWSDEEYRAEVAQRAGRANRRKLGPFVAGVLVAGAGFGLMVVFSETAWAVGGGVASAVLARGGQAWVGRVSCPACGAAMRQSRSTHGRAEWRGSGPSTRPLLSQRLTCDECRRFADLDHSQRSAHS